MEYINGVNQFGNIIVDSDRVTPKESSDSGGISDFSTAEVTVSMSFGTLTLPVVFSGTSDTSDEVPTSGCVSHPISTGNGGTYTVALYKGCAAGVFISDINVCKVVVTGNIVYRAGAFLITGDGTITVTRLSMN